MKPRKIDSDTTAFVRPDGAKVLVRRERFRAGLKYQRRTDTRYRATFYPANYPAAPYETLWYQRGGWSTDYFPDFKTAKVAATTRLNLKLEVG
jgi:hypothetical protein